MKKFLFSLALCSVLLVQCSDDLGALTTACTKQPDTPLYFFSIPSPPFQPKIITVSGIAQMFATKKNAEIGFIAFLKADGVTQDATIGEFKSRRKGDYTLVPFSFTTPAHQSAIAEYQIDMVGMGEVDAAIINGTVCFLGD